MELGGKRSWTMMGVLVVLVVLSYMVSQTNSFHRVSFSAPQVGATTPPSDEFVLQLNGISRMTDDSVNASSSLVVPPVGEDDSNTGATTRPVNGGGDAAEVLLDQATPSVLARREEPPMMDAKGRIINPNRKMDPMRPDVFMCPKFKMLGNDADKKKMADNIVKYSRYATDYCNTTGLMQMNTPREAHHQILSTIARITRIKQNDRVLDWGCGCGTMLNYLHLNFNTTGVGLDLTEGAIRFAWEHSQPRQTFCWMDGSDMSMFPSEHFDAIVSWGGVYHVRRTQVQCSIVTNFVRILKPGGVAFVGHIRTDKSQQYWRHNKCVPPGSALTRYRDFKTFRQPSWKKHGFFSLIVTKTG